MESIAVEQLQGKHPNIADAECLDEGKQTKCMHAPERFGPTTFSAPGVVDEEAVMEVRDCGGVPGVTGQGARAETEHVIDKVGDDHLDDLRGEPGGGGRARRSGLRRSTLGAHLVEFGYSSIPSSLDKQLNSCSGGHD